MQNLKSISYGIFLIRITAGLIFLAHSLYLKVFIFTMSGTSSFFQSLGLPGITAWMVLFIEVIVGIMLILGLKTRQAALASIPVLVGATWAHSGNGWLFSNSGGGWEFPLFWTFVMIAITLTGSGAFSISAHLRKTDRN